MSGDQAFEDLLIGRSGEDVAVFAVDLHGHHDAEQKPFEEGAHEQVGYLWLTCCESPLYRFRNLSSLTHPLGQGRTEGHRGIDELPHVAIDENDVAALAK